MKTVRIFSIRSVVIIFLALPICALAIGFHSINSSAKFAPSATSDAVSLPPCTAPPSGLISWWRGEGNANDIEGTNHGTLQNGVTFAPGRVGQAFNLNGSNQYVLIGDPVPPSLQVQNEITLAAWIFVTSYPSDLGVIIGSQYDASSAGATIMLDGRTNPDGQPAPPGHIHFQIGDGSFHGSNANAQVPLNQWVHIAATRKANEDAKIYYNGVLQPVTSAPWSGAISYDGAWFAIGQQKGLNRPFNGQIDEPELYNRALSAAEIQSIFNAGSAGKCQTPAVSIVDAQVIPGTSGTKQVNFTVNVARSDSNSIDVHYETANGTAFAGTDYVATNGTLHFAANETSKTIPVIVNGLTRTSSQSFTVTLSSPVNAVINRANATGTILTGNAVNDYRNANDSSQTWHYGYTQTDGSGFINFIFFEPSNGTLSQWRKPSSDMAIVKNVTNHDINYNICTLQPADTLALFPGNDGRKTVLRWKAPEAGTFNIAGRFQNADTTTSDITIIKNGVTGSPLFADVINGGSCNAVNIIKPFALNVTVNAGDVIDFRVGWGDNNNFTHDGTGLTVSIEKALVNQTITVNTHAPATAAYNSQFTVAATSDSGLPISYSSSGSCTNTGAVFTMTSGTGTCTVKYDQAGNGNFNPAVQVTETVNAQKADQTINFGEIADKTFGGADFGISAIASSNLTVAFGTTGQCTLSGLMVHITGAGACTVTASQTGDNNYHAAPNVPRPFNIAKALATITLGNLTHSADGNPKFATAATNPAGLNVVISYSQGGSPVTAPTNVGNYDVLATINEANYQGSVSGILVINSKITPTINWNSPADISFGAALSAAQLNATATNPNNGSSVPGTFTYTPPLNTVLNAGPAQTLRVDFAPTDSSTFNTNTTNVSVNVLKANQTINFASLSGKTFGDADFSVSATSTSGLAVTFAASGQCTISGNVVHITAAGPCTITASQAGNSNFNASANVQQTFSISKLDQTITFGVLANKTFGDVPFNLNAIASSGLPVGFTILSGPATINGTTVTLTGAGHVVVRANQTGNNDYNPATPIDQPFDVTGNPLPAPCNPVLTGMSAWYKGDGNANDSSGAGNGGTGHNGVAFDVGRFSQSFKFDGVNDYLSIPDSSTLRPASGLTIEGWIKIPAGVEGYRWIVQKNSANGVSFGLGYASVSNIKALVFSLGRTGSGLVFNAVSDRWYHIALTFDDPTDTLHIYIDGIDRGATTWTDTLTHDNSPMTIGARIQGGTPQDFFQGHIDDLAIYHRALSGPELRAIINAGSAGKCGATVPAVPAPTPTPTPTPSPSPTVTFNLPTNPGSNVTLLPSAGLINFASVTNGGTTTMTSMSPSAAGMTPHGFVIDGSSLAYEISTTASVTAPILVCFSVTSVTNEAAFNQLRMLHGENGVLVDRTISRNFPGKQICGQVSSLSPFLVATYEGSQVDDPQGFVDQHYRDFLSREADPSGLAFWTNEITSCGTDQQCIDVKRINVSAAFYLSIEFSQTGYLVERLYKTAYGDATGVSTFGGPHQLAVPIVRFDEFLPDTQQIGQGVVVGQAGWEQLLDANKRAFTLAFVQRSRFTDAYPTSLTPTQFVNALFAHTGVTPSNADQQLAIDEFGGAANSSDNNARGRALRHVAENSTFAQSEFNRAFVLMEYFAYLRRNPNDAPDVDYSGYDFWLTKLNQFNGNFVNAEMVKAFILSGEYRGRFGSN